MEEAPQLPSSSSWNTLLALASCAFGGVATYGLYCLYNYRLLSQLDDYSPPKPGDFVLGPSQPVSSNLRVRVVDLDGAVMKQKYVLTRYEPEVVSVQSFGPPLRIECSFAQFWALERELSKQTGSNRDDLLPIPLVEPSSSLVGSPSASKVQTTKAEKSEEIKKDEQDAYRPLVTFFGSNDFHHLALLFIRRIRQPINLVRLHFVISSRSPFNSLISVLFDNHPDWFKFFPRLHCGCWFTHAMDLPTVQSAFHFGGDSGEFEDDWGFQPWNHLISQKLRIFPTVERWEGLRWSEVSYSTLRPARHAPLTEERIRALLEPSRAQLKAHPLYVTFDKDCLLRRDNFQNWNSGSLQRSEALLILKVLIEFAEGRLIAMDVTGDFSSVEVHGMLRTYFHKTQHDDTENRIDPMKALPKNERTNLEILASVEDVIARKPRLPAQ